MEKGFDHNSRMKIEINNSGQFNWAQDQAKIEANMTFNKETIQNLAEHTEKLISLLRASTEIPDKLREETIEFVEMVRENVENGKVRKNILKLANDKLNEVSSLISATSALSSVIGTVLNIYNQINS